MQVGDLVQHKIDRSYGIIIEVRDNTTDQFGESFSMVRVFWHTHNLAVLHTTRQVEAVS